MWHFVVLKPDNIRSLIVIKQNRRVLRFRTEEYGSCVFEQKNPDSEGGMEDLILVMGNPASHFWHEENFEIEPWALFLPEILGTTVELDE
jgi:hypothetical protein